MYNWVPNRNGLLKLLSQDIFNWVWENIFGLILHWPVMEMSSIQKAIDYGKPLVQKFKATYSNSIQWKSTQFKRK